MMLLVALGSALVMALVVGYSFIAARDLLKEEMTESVAAKAQAVAGRIEALQKSLQKATEGIAVMVEGFECGDETLYRLLERVMEESPAASGMGVAFAPDASLQGGRRTAPYVHRVSTTTGEPAAFVRKNVVDESEDYTVTDWFSLPEGLGRAVWTEPYFDEAGEDVMATYAVPLYHTAGDAETFFGVATCEVSLEWLTDVLQTEAPGTQGYALLISQNGTFISHPMRDLIMNETMFSVAESSGDERLREVGRRMIRGGTGIAPIVSTYNGLESWLVFCPVPSTGWSVGLVLSQREVMQKVFDLSRIQLVLGGAGVLLLLLVSLLISRTITRPIRELSLATRVLAHGDLDAPLPRPRGGAEVADLATSFEGMRDDLRRHIEELQAATAARARIDEELRLAAGIQLSLVPKTFPPFPERSDVDLYAVLEPAREVGGDFYDFFLVDDTHLCFAVADVSGKGVPAGLFMACTRSYLRAFFRDDLDPARVLARVNAELEADNDACMFVTVFSGVLDLATGSCAYANAGHNPPFVVRAATGEVTPVPRTVGVVLGVQPDVELERGTLVLRPGDRLFMYTDGVTEAMSTAEEPFGEQRLRAVLSSGEAADAGAQVGGPGAEPERTPAGAGESTARSTAITVREAVRAFVGEAEQFDDITILVVKYTGSDMPTEEVPHA